MFASARAGEADLDYIGPGANLLAYGQPAIVGSIREPRAVRVTAASQVKRQVDRIFGSSDLRNDHSRGPNRGSLNGAFVDGVPYADADETAQIPDGRDSGSQELGGIHASA